VLACCLLRRSLTSLFFPRILRSFFSFHHHHQAPKVKKEKKPTKKQLRDEARKVKAAAKAAAKAAKAAAKEAAKLAKKMRIISPTATHRNIAEMLAGVSGSPQEGEVINLTRLLDWDLPEDDGAVNMQNFIFDDIQGIKSPTPSGDMRMSPTQAKIGQLLQGGASFKFSPEPQANGASASVAATASGDGRVVSGLEVYGKGLATTIALESKIGENKNGAAASTSSHQIDRKRRKPGDPQAFSPLMDQMRLNTSLNMSVESSFHGSAHGSANKSTSRVSMSPTGGFFMIPSPTNANSRKMNLPRYSVGSAGSVESAESIHTTPVFEEDMLNGMASEWGFPPEA
jgi:hypothetical protein